MKNRKVLLSLIVSLLCLSYFSDSNVNTGWIAGYDQTQLPYTSASQIWSLDDNVQSIIPEVDKSNIAYLGSLSCLGYYGPASPIGPLGTLGPIGTNLWNPTAWINPAFPWSQWSGFLGKDILSPNGPLGENGPITTKYYYDDANNVFSSNNFAVQTRALGLWTVLGPIGPLGTLGALGALGPTGTFGANYKKSTGEYLDKNNKVIRTCEVPFDNNGAVRTFELFENYSTSFAESMPDNDTSFMTQANFVLGGTKKYNFTSNYDQIVTVLVTPLVQLDKTTIELYSINGQSIAKSDSSTYMNFIQVKLKAGTKMQAVVNDQNLGFRLFVVGSSPYLNMSNITGAHISQYSVSDL